MQIAQELAEKNNLKLAISTRSFEVWLLLHFQYFSRPLTQNDLEAELSDHLGFRYDKSKKGMEKASPLLYENYTIAISNAKQLEAENIKNEKLITTPSSTSVHKLVDLIDRAKTQF
jgi:hypothetical protein